MEGNGLGHLFTIEVQLSGEVIPDPVNSISLHASIESHVVVAKALKEASGIRFHGTDCNIEVLCCVRWKVP